MFSFLRLEAKGLQDPEPVRETHSSQKLVKGKRVAEKKETFIEHKHQVSLQSDPD